MSTGALRDRVVLVTRPPEQAEELASRLHELGAVAVEAPAIDIRPVSTGGALDRAILAVAGGDYEWLVFTSPNGVRHWFERARALGFDARGVRARVAAVGPGTASELEGRGIVANLVPRRYTTEALGAAFPKGRGRVLLARTNVAGEELEEALRAKGWTVRRVVAYRTVRRRSLPTPARDLLRAGRVDAVAFASASSVEAFVRLAAPLDGPKIVCIGPVTARAAEASGLPVHAVARAHTIEGLVAALAAALADDRSV